MHSNVHLDILPVQPNSTEQLEYLPFRFCDSDFHSFWCWLLFWPHLWTHIQLFHL